ncbi:MAG: iron export ABC transporter permease subunit FetB [Candidatus Eisenbacteria bacterium]|nr:iron export ABC transporter permease subunit FetB [Candidatus Eisenbacteria bacterium]
MNVISLSAVDLSVAALLILGLAGLSAWIRLGVGRQILIAALRTTVQLLLIGWVLKALFAHIHLGWVALMALIMLAAAGREVVSRQKRPLAGWRGYGVGSSSMFISSFAITILALNLIIKPDPWYTPQYAIPLLGMMLGNTMNGIALATDRLTQSAWQQRMVIEQRLMLGHTRSQAISDIRRECLRTGMIPMINAMSAAGLVSLPGMMTGQILAGSPPVEAVKYQILIMFLITAGTGFGSILTIWLASHRLFDARHRLRLDRLKGDLPRAAQASSSMNRG